MDQTSKIPVLSVYDENGNRIPIPAIAGKTAYAYAKDGGYTGTEAAFAAKLAHEIPVRTSQLTNDSNFATKNEIPVVTQNTGDDEEKVMSQAAVTAALENLTTLPYGGSKEWLETNGDKTQLYQIDGYVWGYVESDGWTQSGTQFIVVSSENQMTNAGGTEYLLRSDDEGTVYSYTEASGDTGVPSYDSLPTNANEGDIVAVGGRKYKASLSTVTVEHNAYDPNTASFNKRLNSDGAERNLGGALLLPRIEQAYDASCVIAIKGIEKLVKNYGSYGIINYFKADGTHIGQLTIEACKDAVNSGYISSSFSGTPPVSFYLFNYNDTLDTSETAYIYLKLGIATDGTSISASDCEGLVVNFSNKNTTETKTTWTDIGAYTPPVAAGWNATDEKYTVIDSLSSAANSGESAVYSVDGFLYSYIGGAEWVQMSKYNAPTLSIDRELSESSTNAIQNKIVTENFNEIRATTKTHADELTAIKERIGNIATIPTWWQDSVAECISKVKTLQSGRNCVTFPFFSDNHENTGYAGVLIAAVMKECGIPYCFYGGDTIGSGLIPDEATMVAQDKRFDEMMSPISDGRFCRAVGNHDGFWKVSSDEKHGYTRKQVYELFLRAEGVGQNKHFGGDGTYYYVDDIASKVRWVVLDTNPEPVGSAAEIIDEVQLAWLQNTALSFSDNGWGVIVISHCPISNHYHAHVRNAADVIAVVNASGADVIGWYSGHVHRDRIYTYTAINSGDNIRGDDGEPLGFTQVTITSDNTSIAYRNDDGTDSPTKHPIGNDDLSHAIDFVTINKDTRTVHLTRLGIGEDRSYTY